MSTKLSDAFPATLPLLFDSGFNRVAHLLSIVMRRHLRLVQAVFVLLVLIGSLSCGRGRELVSITVQPSQATFFTPNPSGQIQFTALGNYIHPPVTQDITSQVTWKTDVTQLVTINSGGIASPTGTGCGVANVSATMNQHGNLVTGTATVTVNDPTNPVCPGSQTQAVLTVVLNGSGTVTSSPAGLTCPGQCIVSFNTGTAVILTGTPGAGATSVSWVGCDSFSGNQCAVTLSTSKTVNATFQ